ncbi:hypothetical protein G6F66_014635 [Rhizopus arrhizus]|nr:hypothetical protein G6F66_014635 [Rhizopus arrhizus]
MGMRGAAASVLILAMGTSGVALSQQPAAPAAAKETATLNSPKQKLGYAIGLDVAKSFTPIADEIDVAALRTAVELASRYRALRRVRSRRRSIASRCRR